MSSLDCLQVKVSHAFIFSDGGVPSIGQRAGVSIAHTCQIIYISAEGLLHSLGFERAVAVVNYFPDYVVLYHFVEVYLFV